MKYLAILLLVGCSLGQVINQPGTGSNNTWTGTQTLSGGVGALQFPSSSAGTSFGGSPWAFTQTTTTFSGTTDNLFLWGYNPSQEFSTNPTLWNQIEMDYNDGTHHWMEEHADSIAGGVTFRHWNFGRQIDNPTRADYTIVIGTDPASTFMVQDSTTNHTFTVDENGVFGGYEVSLSSPTTGVDYVLHSMVNTTNIEGHVEQDTSGNWVEGLVNGTGSFYTDSRNSHFFRVLGTQIISFDSAGNFNFLKGKGQHINTQAAGNDIAGTCTAAAATTCTVTFTTAYTSAPVCTATDATNIVALKVTPATNQLVITTAASSSDKFEYICIGNPT